MKAKRQPRYRLSTWKHMPATPPKRLTLVDLAYDEIKRRILSNEFAPNFQITEGQLAELLGMSRTPVREALIRLEGEEFIENRPRHGMRVLPLSARQMLEIYQVLTALELLAVELIANRPANERGLNRMRLELDAMEGTLEQRNTLAWAEADARFHRALFENCGNSKLLQTGLGFRHHVDRARMFTLPLRMVITASNTAHRELFKFLEDGDADGAVACHRAHRNRITMELTEIMKYFESQ